MIQRTIAACALFAAVFTPSADAERLNFRTYGLEDGLPQSQVYAAHQDSAGYLWVGTDGGGVSRFDGVRFEVFTDRDGLGDNVIFSITEDSRGRLLMGTAKGMTVYDGHAFHAVQAEQGLSDAMIWAIAEDAQGDLWLASDGDGLLCLSDRGLTRFTTRDGLPTDEVVHVLVDDRGRVWGSTREGAFVLEGGWVQVITTADGLADNAVMSIAQAADGAIWFATGRGASRWDGDTWQSLTTADGLGGDAVWSFFPESDGTMWLATSDGVSRYDGQTTVSWTSRHGLPHRSVETIMRDREGNLWFGTNAGLSRLSGLQVSSIGRDHGLEDSSVWGFWWDHEGVMWIGTESNLVRYDSSSDSVLPPTRAEEEHYSSPLMGDSRGRLWFGADESLLRRENGVYRDLSAELGLETEAILDVFEDSGGRFWIGTTMRGLFVIEEDQVVARYDRESGLLSRGANCVLEDPAGRIWIGTDGGLNIFENGDLRGVDPERSGVRRNVLDMVLDRHGTLWCATYGDGVIGFAPETGKSVTVSRDEGLLHEAALSVTLDREDGLWVGTNRGVSRLDLEIFYSTGRIALEPFGHEEGVHGIECNQGAMTLDEQGRVWVGTIDGAYCIDPAERRLNRVEPATHITGIRLFFEAFDATEHATSSDPTTGLPVDLNLPAQLNHVTFDFTGVSLTVPERVRFQFKLDGFDTKWSPTTDLRHASYAKLPPGDFSFLVRARNNHGLWQERPASFSFSIRAPWWRSTWFYLGATMLAGLAITTVVATRLRRTRRYQRRLEAKIADGTRDLRVEKEKVDEINRELEERILERSNQLAEKEVLLREVHHRVKNNLQIVSSLLRLQTRHAGESSAASQILTESQNRIHSMALVHQMLYSSEDLAQIRLVDYVGALIQSVAQSYPSPASVHLQSDIDDLSLDIDTAIPCGLIVTELVSNALKHAFPDGGRGSVEVGLATDGADLRIAVRDDGVGLPDGFDVSRLKSLGVRLVRTLTEQLDGELEASTDGGAIFVVAVPLPGSGHVPEDEMS